MTRKQTTKRTPATGKGTGTRTGGCKRASAAAKNGKATVQKSGFDVKGTYGKAAKPAVGTSAYANERMCRTGEILAITQTNRKATHKYGKDSKK